MIHKKVVYLFGAGATQGEIQFVDDSIKLLATEVRDSIIKRIDSERISVTPELKNELFLQSDVEHLITL